MATVKTYSFADIESYSVKRIENKHYSYYEQVNSNITI